MDKSNKRRLWSTEETICFLQCYLARKEEFSEVRKKRLGYQHVLEDMIAYGIADDILTPICLERRMRTLVSVFRAAKNNNRGTGASPCLPPYMQLMKKIFGNKPIISNKRTVSLEFKSDVEDLEELEELKVNIPTYAELLPTQEPRQHSRSVINKRKSLRSAYYENKLLIQKRIGEQKIAIFKEKMSKLVEEVRRKWNRELELKEKKLELEERKFELLKKIVHKM
ncbi:uncharacterized protein LOC119669861 [Teleopsis dalmanni]|uniref:uncharacterized protein LOC119669861 n=1 Tax=Teleopsis dalmanni TaxID=139649 RepID=UPI0018CCF10D|nr:uncharacterized protein LOC119669861 [Teleopsis dalmanni]